MTEKEKDDHSRLKDIVRRVGRFNLLQAGRLTIRHQEGMTILERNYTLIERVRKFIPEGKIEEALVEYGFRVATEAQSVVDAKRQIVRALDEHGEQVLASPNPFASEGMYYISPSNAIPNSKPGRVREPAWERSRPAEAVAEVKEAEQAQMPQVAAAPVATVQAAPAPAAVVQKEEAPIDYAALAQAELKDKQPKVTPLPVVEESKPAHIPVQEPVLPEHTTQEIQIIQMPAISTESLYKVQLSDDTPPAKPTRRRTIAEALLELGFGDVQAGEMMNPKLDQTLLKQGRITLEQAAQAQALSRSLTYVDPKLDPPNQGVSHLLDENTCRSERVFPYDMKEDGTFVVLTDMAIKEAFVKTKVAERTGQRHVEVRITSTSALDALIREQYTSATALEELHQELESATANIPEVNLTAENAVNRFITDVVLDGAQRGASDIHFEPMKEGLQVRFRIDGKLRPAMRQPIAVSGMANIVRVVKLMAKMDVGNNRTPQDNRISLKIGERRLNMRVNSMPQTNGNEKIVMRILKDAGDIPSIDNLGMLPQTLARFKNIIRKPEGLFLVTGPTGSGKSFTLYSALKTAATPDRNAQTLEDPIEYEIPGLNQSQVNAESGYTFAAGLRAAMRQDPDLLLLGEIRDGETANISLSMANTGHQVFSTLHTINAPAAVQRLRDLGAQNYNISPSLQGILAQRLIPKLCPHCSTPAPLPERVKTTLEEAGLSYPEDDYRKVNLQGCPRCENGRRGRMPIHELLVVSPAIRELINNNGSTTEIQETAVKEGMLTLMLDGYLKVASGHLGIEDLESALNEIALEKPDEAITH